MQDTNESGDILDHEETVCYLAILVAQNARDYLQDGDNEQCYSHYWPARVKKSLVVLTDASGLNQIVAECRVLKPSWTDCGDLTQTEYGLRREENPGSCPQNMQYLLIDLLIVGVYAFEESAKAAKCVAVLSCFVFHCSILV